MKNTVKNCTFGVTVNIGEAAIELAQALRAQAEANEALSDAALELAKKLNATPVTALEIGTVREGD